MEKCYSSLLALGHDGMWKPQVGILLLLSGFVWFCLVLSGFVWCCLVLSGVVCCCSFLYDGKLMEGQVKV
jgi:hypothetical protein